MPFDIVLPVLGSCFVSAWVFIGGLLLRESLEHVRRIRIDAREEMPPAPLA